MHTLGKKKGFMSLHSVAKSVTTARMVRPLARTTSSQATFGRINSHSSIWLPNLSQGTEWRRPCRAVRWIVRGKKGDVSGKLCSKPLCLVAVRLP